MGYLIHGMSHAGESGGRGLEAQGAMDWKDVDWTYIYWVGAASCGKVLQMCSQRIVPGRLSLPSMAALKGLGGC